MSEIHQGQDPDERPPSREGSASSDLAPRRTPTPEAEGPPTAFSIHYGRPYHNELWAYRFPVTQEEVTRLDRVHDSLRDNGPFRGPVEEVLTDRSRYRRLLDVGCGTGTWLIEMAQRFPHVDCVGIDFLEQQHSTNNRNTTFMQVNIPNGMHVLASGSFDVVHIRSMIYAIPDYTKLLAQSYRILRPGGLILIHEPNLQCYSAYEGYTVEQLAPGLVQWSRAFRAALAYHGIDMRVFDHMENHLGTAGFNMGGIDAFFHYRPLCPVDTSDAAQNDTECTRALVSASKLSIVESGQLDADAFDALEAKIGRELAGESDGEGGPLGGRGVFSPWGYWWVRK